MTLQLWDVFECILQRYAHREITCRLIWFSFVSQVKTTWHEGESDKWNHISDLLAFLTSSVFSAADLPILMLYIVPSYSKVSSFICLIYFIKYVYIIKGTIKKEDKMVILYSVKPATKHFLAVPHPSRIVICERPLWYMVQQDVQIIGICVFFISVSRMNGVYKCAQFIDE